MVRHRDTDINSNLIIENVKYRPCLYESNHPSFGDRAVKSRAWEDVYQAVVPMWCSMASEDRFAAGKEVQKRWRSIRDSYTKAYRQGKCVLPENCPPASRRYQYHQQMSFLLLALQNKKPRHSQEKQDNSISDVSNSPQHLSVDDDKHKIDTAKCQTVTNNHQRQETRENSAETTIDNDKTIETLTPSFEIKIDATTVMSHDHFYDDEQFMNSLLPFFKNMSDTTRLVCRIEILKIIHSALNKLSTEASCQTTMEENEAKNERIKNESTLTMTTRSADGSRPVRKRCSDSPPPVAAVPPKKRGPGRPRKVRPPTNGEQEQPKTQKVTEKQQKCPKASGERKAPKDSEEVRASNNRVPRLKVQPVEVPNMMEIEESLNKATTVVNMSIPLFMKIYNLKHTTLSPESKKPSIKEEQPVVD